MAQPQFAGITLIQNNAGALEGGYNFQPGMKGRAIEIGRTARATVSYAKDLGQNPAQHNLTLTYNVDEDFVDDIIDRINDLADGTIGNLIIESFGTYRRCIISTPPTISEVTKTEKGYHFKITVTFEEL